MDKDKLNSLNKGQVGQVGVAYLMHHPEEIPDSVKALFDKLSGYDKAMKGIINALSEAQKTISELQPKSEQLYGSISTLSEVIVDMLPEEDLRVFAGKYDFSKESSMSNIPSTPPQNTPIDNAVPNIDMAGSTAKRYNEENPVNLSKPEQAP